MDTRFQEEGTLRRVLGSLESLTRLVRAALGRQTAENGGDTTPDSIPTEPGQSKEIPKLRELRLATEAAQKVPNLAPRRPEPRVSGAGEVRTVVPIRPGVEISGTTPTAADDESIAPTTPDTPHGDLTVAGGGLTVSVNPNLAPPEPPVDSLDRVENALDALSQGVLTPEAIDVYTRSLDQADIVLDFVDSQPNRVDDPDILGIVPGDDRAGSHDGGTTQTPEVDDSLLINPATFAGSAPATSPDDEYAAFADAMANSPGSKVAFEDTKADEDAAYAARVWEEQQAGARAASEGRTTETPGRDPNHTYAHIQGGDKLKDAQEAMSPDLRAQLEKIAARGRDHAENPNLPPDLQDSLAQQAGNTRDELADPDYMAERHDGGTIIDLGRRDLGLSPVAGDDPPAAQEPAGQESAPSFLQDADEAPRGRFSLSSLFNKESWGNAARKVAAAMNPVTSIKNAAETVKTAIKGDEAERAEARYKIGQFMGHTGVGVGASFVAKGFLAVGLGATVGSPVLVALAGGVAASALLTSAFGVAGMMTGQKRAQELGGWKALAKEKFAPKNYKRGLLGLAFGAVAGLAGLEIHDRLSVDARAPEPAPEPAPAPAAAAPVQEAPAPATPPVPVTPPEPVQAAQPAATTQQPAAPAEATAAAEAQAKAQARAAWLAEQNAETDKLNVETRYDIAEETQTFPNSSDGRVGDAEDGGDAAGSGTGDTDGAPPAAKETAANNTRPLSVGDHFRRCFGIIHSDGQPAIACEMPANVDIPVGMQFQAKLAL